MNVEVYWSPSCPHRAAVEEIVKKALSEAGVDVPVTYIEVTGPEDAKTKRCLGSPTIRVDGLDVEYGNREPDETTPGCRYYNTPEGWVPLPPKGMIVRALSTASR